MNNQTKLCGVNVLIDFSLLQICAITNNCKISIHNGHYDLADSMVRKNARLGSLPGIIQALQNGPLNFFLGVFETKLLQSSQLYEPSTSQLIIIIL